MPVKVIWSFLTSAVGRWVLLALALSIWTTYQRIDAAGKAKASCQQAHFEQQVAEKTRQLEAARQVADNARKRADEAEANLAKLREAANALQDQIGGVCDIPDDIRRKLRAIQ